MVGRQALLAGNTTDPMNSRTESSAWRTWFDAALNLIYPNVCQICGAETSTAAGGYVGTRCWDDVRFLVEPFCTRCGLPFEGDTATNFECSNCRDLDLGFEWARAAVAAKGVVLDVIHRYKYHGALWFEPFLTNLLLRAATRSLRSVDWDLIVPVPLHPVRERHREFNQAERMGRALSRATGIPLVKNLILRTGATETQTLLSRSKRAENVHRAFAMRPGRRLDGERIILVDDVLTTGATTSACAWVLRRKGAGSVAVWTVARGL